MHSATITHPTSVFVVPVWANSAGKSAARVAAQVSESMVMCRGWVKAIDECVVRTFDSRQLQVCCQVHAYTVARQICNSF
jgi:hypothetical protein